MSLDNRGVSNPIESKPRTVQEWLNDLATSKDSSGTDWNKFENMLRRIGYPNASVTYGMVYYNGYGRPVSIHDVAKELVAICEGHE